jgi:hypothetical protein
VRPNFTTTTARHKVPFFVGGLQRANVPDIGEPSGINCGGARKIGQKEKVFMPRII